MNPALKLYLDKLHAETRAQYAEIHKQLQLQEALFSKFDTGASTPQSAGSAVMTSDGGLTVDATAVAAVPDVSCSTTKAQEVLHGASPDSIDPMPMTCSTDGSNQVVATASVNVVHDAATTVCPESLVDLNDKEVEQPTPVRSTPFIGTGTSSITEEVVPSVAATPAVTPTATVHISLELTDSAVSAEPFDIDTTDAAALTHTKCSRKGSMQVPYNLILCRVRHGVLHQPLAPAPAPKPPWLHGPMAKFYEFRGMLSCWYCGQTLLISPKRWVSCNGQLLILAVLDLEIMNIVLRNSVSLLQYNPSFERLLSPWNHEEQALGIKSGGMGRTEHLPGTIKLMRILGQWIFFRSMSFAMQFTVEASEWMIAGILCFILPHAKPPDTYDKCTIILREMQGITLASCLRITVTKFKQPCSGICGQPHDNSWVSFWLVLLLFRYVVSPQVSFRKPNSMEEPFSCFQGTQLQSWRPPDQTTSCAIQSSREEAIHWEQVHYKGLQFSPYSLEQPLEGGEYFIPYQTAYGFYLEMIALVSNMWKSDHCWVARLCLVQWHHMLLGILCSAPSCTFHVSIKSWFEQQNDRSNSLLAVVELTLRPMHMRILQAVEIFNELISTVTMESYSSSSSFVHPGHVHKRGVLHNNTVESNKFKSNFSSGTHQFEKLWPAGTQEEIFHHRWSVPLSSIVHRQWNPGDEQRYSEDIFGYYGNLLVFLACLVVQPISCCELIPIKESFSYLQGAQRQSSGPPDRVTDRAEHAKKGSKLMHAEQVNYKVLQSHSCYMVQQLEGIGMATNFRTMKLQMPSTEASETFGSGTTYPISDMVQSNEVHVAAVHICEQRTQNYKSLRSYSCSMVQFRDESSLAALFEYLITSTRLRDNHMGTPPGGDTGYGEHEIITSCCPRFQPEQHIANCYSAISPSPALHTTSSCPDLHSQVLHEMMFGYLELPGMRMCWMYVKLISAIERWVPAQIQRVSVINIAEVLGVAVHYSLGIPFWESLWEEFLAEGATLPFYVTALMCKSQLQQPTRCLPCHSILVIGLYVTHNFYMASAGVQVALQEGRDVRDGIASLDQIPHGSDYYLSHDRFFKLVQVHLNYGYYHDNYHRDPGMIKDLQAPWDPGEFFMTAAWGQAAFQEGRDVRDLLGSPLASTWAEPSCALTRLPLQVPGKQATRRASRWIRQGTARTAPSSPTSGSLL